MSTLRVNAIQNTSGVEQYLARAWVNFNGTGTVAIRASGNVSSITDNGTGDYTVNFTNAMADANYAVYTTVNSLSSTNRTGRMMPIGDGSETGLTGTYSSSAVRLKSYNENDGGADKFVCCVAIFR
jgi:hypothetical protein